MRVKLSEVLITYSLVFILAYSCTSENSGEPSVKGGQVKDQSILDENLTNRLSAAFQKEDYDEATRLLPEWCAAAKGDIAEFWCPYYAGRICWGKERYIEAIQLFEHVKQVIASGNKGSFVQIVEVEVVIAHCNLKLGRKDLACETFQSLPDSIKRSSTPFARDLGGACE